MIKILILLLLGFTNIVDGAELKKKYKWQKIVYITMGPVSFYPKEVTITPGTRVVWYNNSDSSHNAYPIKPKYLINDQSYSKLFKKEGVYKYYCIPHKAMGMKGTINVVKRKKK